MNEYFKFSLTNADTSKNVRLKVKLNANSIADFLARIRDSNRKIDLDILILHVKNGRDIFLTVTGEYRPSCFGLSAETMCKTNRAMCRYTEAELRELVGLEICLVFISIKFKKQFNLFGHRLQMCDDSPDYRVTMPREYFLLIDHLYNLQEKATGIFANNDYTHSKTLEFNEICEWLDTWSDTAFRKFVAFKQIINIFCLQTKILHLLNSWLRKCRC